MFHEIAAATVVEVRGQFERLKHADVASAAESLMIEETFSCVEGLLLIICRVRWLTADPATVERIKSRLADQIAA